MKEYLLTLATSFQNPITAIAQILGFIPMFMGFFIFRSNNRKTCIATKAVSDFLSAIHFALLSQWTGCAINCINIFRGFCFSQRGQRKWASTIWMPIGFCIATAVGTALSWAGLKSLLPLVGSCLAVVGYWCTDPRLLRKFNFAGVSLWAIYGILAFSVPTIVGNLISMTTIILTELRLRRQKEDFS